MKGTLLSILLFGLACGNSYAQVDDVYYVPHKTNAQVRNIGQDANRAAGNAWNNDEEDAWFQGRKERVSVDAYNRRSAGQNDYQRKNYQDANRSYADGGDLEDDYLYAPDAYYTSRLVRFHSPTVGIFITSPYYWDSWSGLYDAPWFYGGYSYWDDDPRYWNTCSPWRRSWAYSPWGGYYPGWGYYNPYYSPWYDPYYGYCNPYWGGGYSYAGCYPGWGYSYSRGRSVYGGSGKDYYGYRGFRYNHSGNRSFNSYNSRSSRDYNPSGRPRYYSGGISHRSFQSSSGNSERSRSYSSPSSNRSWSSSSGSRSWGGSSSSGSVSSGRSFGGGGGRSGGGRSFGR